MLDTIIIDPPNKNPELCVIWLHGLGADGNDFAPIAKQLSELTQRSIRFVFPHAPLQPVTLNNGYVMRAWYDIFGLTLETREDKPGLSNSMKLLDALIQQQHMPTEKIILAGFSQGGALALYAGLRYPQKLAGIIALSAYLPFRNQLSLEKTTVNQTTPILMAHGTRDNIVPIDWAEISKEILLQENYAVDWHTYPMEHNVCWEEIEAIAKFVGARCACPLQ